MKGRCDLELGALGPDLVVVVLAVETEVVEPCAVLRQPGRLLERRGDGTFDPALHAHDFVTELANGVLEMADGLLGSMHRNRSHRRHAVGMRAHQIDDESVVRAHYFFSYVGISEVDDEQTGARVKEDEIDTEV